MEIRIELAQKLADTYAKYRKNLLAKNENTKALNEVINDGINKYALNIYDLRKLNVPEYIARNYSAYKLFDSNLSFELVRGFRDKIKNLVDERIAIDKEYDELTAAIVDVKRTAADNGLSFLQIIQATEGMGEEELKSSTLYTLTGRIENRTTEKKLEKMAYYLLHKELGIDINTLSERTGKAKSTIFNLSRGGQKLYEKSDRSLESLTVDELLEIARGDTPINV